MGCFGYICPKCGTNIRGGEVCVLRNVRHGEVIDETTGHYNEYGGVEESDTFDTRDAAISCFDFDDSIWRYETYRILNGKLISYNNYMTDKIHQQNEKMLEILEQLKEGKEVVDWSTLHMSHYDISEEFSKLPIPDVALAKSGVSAYHKYCFDNMSDAEKAENICSRSDPDQSWGRARKKYI